MLEIMEIHDRCLENRGMLQPFICTASDGKQYYCKGSNAQVKGLLNEWICSHLARSLELPIPEAQVLTLGSDLKRLLPPDWQRDLEFNCLFGLQAVSGSDTLSYSRVTDVPDPLQKKLLVFDAWVRNADRCLTSFGGNVNLLLDLKQNQLWVIDHNLAFDADFSRQDFLELHVFSGLLKARKLDMIDLVNFSKAFSQARESLEKDLPEVPDEWLNADPDASAKIQEKMDVLMECEKHHFLEWLL